MRFWLIVGLTAIALVGCGPSGQIQSEIDSIRKRHGFKDPFEAVELGTLEDLKLLEERGGDLHVSNDLGNLLHALARNTRDTTLNFHSIHPDSSKYIEVGMGSPGYVIAALQDNLQSKAMVSSRRDYEVPFIHDLDKKKSRITFRPKDDFAANELIRISKSGDEYALCLGNQWYRAAMAKNGITVYPGPDEGSVHDILKLYVQGLKGQSAAKSRFEEAVSISNYLISKQVRRDDRNTQGRSVYEEAKHFGNLEYLKILETIRSGNNDLRDFRTRLFLNSQ